MHPLYIGGGGESTETTVSDGRAGKTARPASPAVQVDCHSVRRFPRLHFPSPPPRAVAETSCVRLWRKDRQEKFPVVVARIFGRCQSQPVVIQSSDGATAAVVAVLGAHQQRSAAAAQ